MENNDLLEEAKKFGFVRDNQVWLRAFMDYPERQVGEVKEVEDESLQYFAHRFGLFRQGQVISRLLSVAPRFLEIFSIF